jgi:hypothetical protein
MTSQAPWKGWLRKGDTAGTVTGELVDSWGWRVALTGTFVATSGSYALTGVLGEPPSSLVIGAIDEEAEPPK